MCVTAAGQKHTSYSRGRGEGDTCHSRKGADLSGADEDAVNVCRRLDLVGEALVDDRQKLFARRHVRQRRDHLRVAEKALGREDHERFTESSLHLAAQAVEVVGGRGDVDNLPVGALDLHALFAALGVGHDGGVLVRHLQEPLKPRRRVLRTLALVAVGQEHDEAGLPQPLLLPRGDELVDDDLRRVGKVAELGLPQHEGVGVLERVPELKAEHAVLAQVRVEDGKRSLLLRQVHTAVLVPPTGSPGAVPNRPTLRLPTLVQFFLETCSSKA